MSRCGKSPCVLREPLSPCAQRPSAGKQRGPSVGSPQAWGDDSQHQGRLMLVGQMAAALTHELAQPLGAIANYIEAALVNLNRHSQLAEQDLLPLKMALAQVNRAGQIAHNITNFLRKRQDDRQPLDLAWLIHRALSDLLPYAKEHKVNLSIQPSPVPLPVLADAIQIQQVINNLVRNSIEAIAAAHGPKRIVTIRCRALHKQAIIKIEDTGPGFSDPLNTKDLFAAFHTTKPDGLGLGLWISREIMEHHGGALKLCNAPDHVGAIAILEIPLANDLITS